MDKVQMDLAKVIENYFGADAGYLDIDCFTLARRIMEAGWTEPVRCKDCKHSYDGVANIMCGRCGQNINGIRLGGVSVKEEHFCAYGERITDG